MSVLMYKQRFRNPNLKKTAGANYAHVRYIATRPRVMKNENMAHGLFGRLQPGDVIAFEDWRSIASAVYANSRKGIIMYRSIISFSRWTAEELHLQDQEKWKRYLERHIATIAEKNNIRRENLQWAAAIHNEKDHPHAHIVFWDKSGEIRNAYTPPAIPNAIRKQLIKDTFPEKIRRFLEEKEKAANTVRQILDEHVEAFENYYRRSEGIPYQQIDDELDTELEGAFDMDEACLMDMGNKLLQLRTIMPEKGRLSYKLLPPEVKKEVDEFTLHLLREIPQLDEAARNYAASKKEMACLYSSDNNFLNEVEETYLKEIITVASNRVLSGIRMLIRLEKEGKKIEYFVRRRDFYTYRICMEILESCMVRNTEWKKEQPFVRGELSKEAKKEWYLKNQDKGYEH